MKKIVFVVYGLLAMIISLPVMLIFKIMKKEEKFCAFFLAPFFRSLLKILNVKVEIKGEIDYPLKNTLVVSNHASMLDIVLLIGYIKEDMIFVSKQENKKIPILRLWMIICRTIFIKRDNLRNTLKEMKKTTEFLKEEQAVMIFPQGTRDAQNIEFKAGSLKFVKKAKGNILPLAIKGTDLILVNNFSYKKNTIILFANELIPYSESENENLVELQTQIENKIKEQIL